MLVVLGIVNLRKNLEHEVDVPTEEKRNCCRNFVCCGNTNVHCTILSRVVRIVLGEVELCRMHMPSASLVRAETVQVLDTAVKEKVGVNGCWRKCSPEPVMGGQDPWILCSSRYGDWDCKHLQRGCSCAASQSNVLKIHSSQDPKRRTGGKRPQLKTQCQGRQL